MFVNENKGNFGMFSRAGVQTTEKYHILMKKDEILNPTNKRFISKTLFENKPVVDTEENVKEEVDIFAQTMVKVRKRTKKKKYVSQSNYRYHNDIREKLKSNTEYPALTKYNPKYDYVSENQDIGGPAWETTFRKNHSVLPKQEEDAKYYLAHESLNLDCKNFIDFNKQTRRPDFNKSNDLRSIVLASGENFFNINKQDQRNKSVSYFHQTKYKNKNDNEISKDEETDNNITNTKMDEEYLASKLLYKRMNKNKDKYNDKDQRGSTFNNSGDSEKRELGSTRHGSTGMPVSVMKARSNSTFMINNYNSNNSNNNTKSTFKSKEEKRSEKLAKQQLLNKIPAPDFGKIISRDKYTKLHEPKINIYRFNIPNRNQVEPKPICKLNYNVKTHRNRNCDVITKVIHPMAPDNPYKNFEKINNYAKITGINFGKTSSRDGNNPDDALPCYFKNIYTRGSVGSMSEKTLQMTNFKNSKFAQTSTSFFPKKSFNKIVNQTLLNNTNFADTLKLNDGDSGRMEQINQYIKKSMKFYKKNMDDLTRDVSRNKFDNVTFKTIKNERKFDDKELENYIRHFDKVDIDPKFLI